LHWAPHLLGPALPEPLQKILTKFYVFAEHVWVDLEPKTRTSYVRCFEII